MTDSVDPTRGVRDHPIQFDHHATGRTEEEVWAGYEALRDAGEVNFSDLYGGFWLVCSYAGVKQILRDYPSFSSTPSHRLPQGNNPSIIPIDFDPPEHTTYRDAVVEALRPHRLRAANDFIVDTVATTVAEFHAAGGGEVRRGLAMKIPFRILTGILGISRDTVDQLLMLSDSPRKTSEGEAAHHSLDTTFRGLIEAEIEAHRARSEPSGDYVDWLLSDQVDTGTLTETEAVDVLLTLAVSGFRTTMNSISTLMYVLGSDLDLQRLLRSDPTQSTQFVEEMLRLRSPAQNLTRRTTCPVHLGDVAIPAGESVVVSLAAGNRDPDMFPDPTVFDPTRPNRGHLAFGWGIHQCAGAPLARAELKVLLETLCDYPIFEVEGDVEFGNVRDGLHFGPVSLNVRFADNTTAT